MSNDYSLSHLCHRPMRSQNTMASYGDSLHNLVNSGLPQSMPTAERGAWVLTPPPPAIISSHFFRPCPSSHNPRLFLFFVAMEDLMKVRFTAM